MHPCGDINCLLMEDLTVSLWRTSMYPCGGIFQLTWLLPQFTTGCRCYDRASFVCLVGNSLQYFRGSVDLLFPSLRSIPGSVFIFDQVVYTTDAILAYIFVASFLEDQLQFLSSSGLPPSRRTCCDLLKTTSGIDSLGLISIVLMFLSHQRIYRTLFPTLWLDFVVISDVMVGLRSHRNLVQRFVVVIN